MKTQMTIGDLKKFIKASKLPNKTPVYIYKLSSRNGQFYWQAEIASIFNHEMKEKVLVVS